MKSYFIEADYEVRKTVNFEINLPSMLSVSPDDIMEHIGEVDGDMINFVVPIERTQAANLLFGYNILQELRQVKTNYYNNNHYRQINIPLTSLPAVKRFDTEFCEGYHNDACLRINVQGYHQPTGEKEPFIDFRGVESERDVTRMAYKLGFQVVFDSDYLDVLDEDLDVSCSET